MTFRMPEYEAPNFNAARFTNAKDAVIKTVATKGVAPANFHATTIYPEYFKISGNWLLAVESRMDCVVAVQPDNSVEVKEFRRLEVGDRVVTGRTEDGSEGIFVHTNGFDSNGPSGESFAFRTGRTRETSFSMDYDRLYDLLRHEKDQGHIVWVLGPAVSFDSDSRKALASLINNGFVHAILAGNALATHDLEGALFQTALGQDIYTKYSVPNGHYHHLDAINMARSVGSMEALIKQKGASDGIIHACIKKGVPVVLASSIRDDGPLPEVIANAYEAQDAMRMHTRKATTVLCLATQLHSIAAGNMTPIYTVAEGKVRPVFIYTIDISEFAVNKLRDRGSLVVTSIVTNIQDFLVNLERNLIRQV